MPISTTEPSRQQGPDALPPLLLLEPQLAPARPSKDDWRLSRTAKPLLTWRLSK